VRGTRKVPPSLPVASSLSLRGGEGHGRLWPGQGGAGQRQL